jgi:hypothetical protein
MNFFTPVAPLQRPAVVPSPDRCYNPRAMSPPSDPAATARPCPYCGIPVTEPHPGCSALFKEVMSAPAQSTLDEIPPEAREFEADESRRLGDYILVDQVGKGGMGTVWRAWDRKLTRWVAVKFLNGQDQDDFARFSREAKLAARLRHPNIAAVFDTGEVASKQVGQDSVRYLAMEFIEGQSVSTAELPLVKWLDIFARVARALDHAHRSGVVHRDIKPTNLMLTREHWPYVMDFGLAKSLKAGSSVSISGVILGTPAFMPPEQAAGKIRETDERSDVYSLGATMYYVLTRREPFRGEDSVDVIIQVLQKRPPRPREIKPDLPLAVEAVILKAMAHDKEERYASAGEMADDLERILAAGAPTLSPPRRRLPAAVLVALLLAGVAAIVFMAKPRSPVQAPAQAAGGPIEKPSPLPAFVGRFRELKDAKQWRAARAWVEQEGAFLSPAERSDYAREIEEGCRESLQKVTAAFCSGPLTERLEASPPEFRFESLESDLPQPDQLLLPHPAYDWTRRLLATIDAARPEPLFQAAAESVALAEGGENPWFRAAELAAFQVLLRDLRKQSGRARGGARATVKECRTAADQLASPWDALLGGLPPPFRNRHAPMLDKHDAAIRGAREDFPADPPYLQSIDLGKILSTPDPEQRLDEVEKKLRALWSGGDLTRESQQSLLVQLVTARALLLSYQGAGPEQIARELQEFAEPLRNLGVTGEERSRFGPKVSAVFDRLLR